MKDIKYALRRGILILISGSLTLVNSFENLASAQISETRSNNNSANEIVQLRSAYEKHYLNTDGSVTAVIHSMPMHYYENGEWLEIDNKLHVVKNSDGSLAYRNTNSPMQVTLPQELESGSNILSIKHGDHTIEWVIITQDQTTSVSSGAELIDIQRSDKSNFIDKQSRLAFEATDYLTSQVRYNDVFEDTDIEYTIFPEHIKEDIILNEWNGVSNYQYQLNTDLEARIIADNSINFVDATGKVVFTIPQMFMYDSAEISECSYSVGVTLSENSDGYLMTIALDTEWLSDTDRVYPVIVDPTITLQNNSVSDTTIYSGMPNNNYGSSEYLVVGEHGDTYGTGKALISFPITSLPTIESVESATLNLREGSGQTYASHVLLYAMDSGWSESTGTWRTTYGGDSQLYVSSSTVSNNSWNYFDITNAVQWWYNHSHTQAYTGVPNWGLVIQASSSFSSKHFCSSEHANYAPSVTITYNTNMYSLKYKPYKYNNIVIQNNFQYRMNCYGYAMQMYFRGALSDLANTGYKQQPGEFSSSRGSYNNLLLSYYEYFSCTDIEFMNFLISKISADFNSLGYTLTQTTATSSVPSGKRKIALVITPQFNGIRDYHFYVRESQGYWSHKSGTSPVTNKALSDNTIILTDDNIADLSLHHNYTAGIRFFLIDKDVNVYDSAHANGMALSGGTTVY